ncbi:rhythmically expressed gene 2 protein [Episyrphus balteatus]|uniref:rhythmically expressed gene 2 protein n=1 Tax=Episyrphus balteatus TaxID=286459 RepID=UPI002484FE38|nr:rhythmically expressed gene 2 protein [Episyrphus balteatus]
MPLTPKFIQNLQKFRLVTFDITDTLLTFKRSPAIQYAETAANHGYPHLNRDKLLVSFRKEFKQHMIKYPNYGKTTPNMDWNQWWIKLVLNIFESVESGIPEKDALIIAKELVDLYRTDVCWKHLDGASELVCKVRESGKDVGVISNFDPSLPQILKAMNLNNFDFILTAYDCGILKPNREIFDLALAKYNIRSDQAIHIGNMYDLDYLGAKAAGWSSILISKMTEDEMAVREGLNRQHVFQNIPDLLHTLNHKVIEW